MRYNFLRFPQGKLKAFTMSYDDGSPNDVRLIRTANKYGVKVTLNLVAANMPYLQAPLTKEFLENEVLGKGHEIANHGFCHMALDRVRTIDGLKEVLNGRLTLEKEFGTIIQGMAFADVCINRFKKPDTYEKVKNYLTELDVAYARTAGDDNDRFELPEDWHNWMPTVHSTNPKTMEYLDKFIGINKSNLWNAISTPKLFFVWGHSNEFEGLGNWELLEEMCQKVSDKEDIWFATSIEICEYVKAYNSLVYSADGKIVYNPTLFDIWFDVDGTLYCIKSGETLKI